MKKLIIIPAYNEESNIPNVIKDILEYAKECDYIIINDASTDNTEKICKDNKFNYITLPQNLGIGGAVQTGYIYAKHNNYDIAIQFDGDGQHNAKDINLLVEQIENGADICIGSRYIYKEGFQSTYLRRVGKNIISFVIKCLCNKKITDPTSGFRACNKKIINMFANNYPDEYPEPETIVRIIINKYLLIEVPTIMNQRKGGKSSITPIKSLKYMLKVIISIFFARLEGKEKNKCY